MAHIPIIPLQGLLAYRTSWCLFLRKVVVGVEVGVGWS